jgi:3-hydroxybutyryl-CoA dehydrogenase
MKIQQVGVLGCGLMGAGIAQVAAAAGFKVTVLEVEQRFIDKGFAAIEKSLAKLEEKGKLKEPAQAIRARLKGTTRKEDLADCDLIIEAIIEDVQLKKQMYTALDAIVKKEAIFASNTSSISITELLTSTKRPERSYRCSPRWSARRTIGGASARTRGKSWSRARISRSSMAARSGCCGWAAG